MIIKRAVLAGLCCVAVACSEDPAKSTKIVPRPAATQPPAPATDDTPASRSFDTAPRPGQKPPVTAGAAGWKPADCPPPPEASSGQSSLVVTGPCPFEHKAAVACEPLADDFLVTMTRKAAGESTLMVFINVEFYKGPGKYTGGQMFLGLQDKKNIYRWSSDAVTVTVADGETSAKVESAKLLAEPLLVNCTGPMNNYQCEGRGEAEAFERTSAVVSGTLQCEGKK